jgi:hypothetical protein
MPAAGTSPGDDTLLVRRRRATDKVTTNDEAAAAEPLDEEEQGQVIRQFESEIDGQFRLLRRVVVAVCVLWGAVVLVLLTLRPVHLCRLLVNRGAFVSESSLDDDDCPSSHAAALVRGVGVALVVPHALTVASLLQSDVAGGGGGGGGGGDGGDDGGDGGHSPSGSAAHQLQRLSLFCHALPLVVIAYSCFVLASPDLLLLRGVLAAMVAAPSLLLLFLARSVFACRDDLRSGLQRLAAKRYSYKAL